MVNFIYQLNWAKDAQLVKHCFQNRLISIWISRMVKKITLTNSGEQLPSTESLNRTKRQKVYLLFLLELGHSSFPALRHHCSWFSILQTWNWTHLRNSPICRPLDLDWVSPLAFLVLHLADSRSWNFSASIILWANSYNKSPFIYLSYRFCLSGEP